MPQTRHCLVTGANRGLGLEFVRQLLARGHHVVATCRQPGRATTLNMLTGEHPGRLHVLPLDLAAPRSHAELVRELPLVLGGGDGRLDLLVNNAGVLHSGERFGQVEPAQLEDSLRTNAAGPFLLTQALAPLLADRSPDRAGAVVVNLSSRLGSIAGVEGFSTPTYAVSKAALNMATVLLARALSERGITVLAVSPGWVRTDMGGEDAPLEAPESVAGLLDRVEVATPDESGRFIDYRGEAIDW
ncbi:SDR family oxidoreductase [Lysobacter sp. A3-1-A15]|uniref:SDR family oxidoreductase n=1 Tax=Novilysobacter viscosus TaxID=3098602 RepID=UPI002ED9C60A